MAFPSVPPGTEAPEGPGRPAIPAPDRHHPTPRVPRLRRCHARRWDLSETGPRGVTRGVRCALALLHHLLRAAEGPTGCLGLDLLPDPRTFCTLLVPPDPARCAPVGSGWGG